jgi:hypothetical protein
MNNLDLYNKFRTVPAEAKKTISGGRMNGKTDINPMWRLKALTEQFGPCGIGWKYVITDKRLERGGNDEVSAFVDIDLFVKVDGAWSDAIPGTGGSSFVAKEKSGLFTNDECFKMALTDAISVACKALGVAADVYFDKDPTKYDGHSEPPTPQSPPPKKMQHICQDCGKEIKGVKVSGKLIYPEETIATSKAKFGKELCYVCLKSAAAQEANKGGENAG